MLLCCGTARALFKLSTILHIVGGALNTTQVPLPRLFRSSDHRASRQFQATVSLLWSNNTLEGFGQQITGIFARSGAQERATQQYLCRQDVDTILLLLLLQVCILYATLRWAQSIKNFKKVREKLISRVFFCPEAKSWKKINLNKFSKGYMWVLSIKKGPMRIERTAFKN